VCTVGVHASACRAFQARGAPWDSRNTWSAARPESFEAEQYRGFDTMVEQLHRSTTLSVDRRLKPDRATADDDDLQSGPPRSSSRRASAPGRCRSPRGKPWRRTSGSTNTRNQASWTRSERESHVGARTSASHVNLSVITAGSRPSAPTSAESPRVGELLEEARRKYDYIVIDTAPLVSVHTRSSESGSNVF